MNTPPIKNEAAVALGRLSHSRQSEAQSEASRRNGKAGGRPRLLANEQHDGSESNAPTCSPLDFAVLAGIRAAAKAGIAPLALAVHRRDAAEDTLGSLPVMTSGTLQFDDWETGCKYLPLFGSNNVATLKAERAFMEAFSLENVQVEARGK